MARSPRQGQFLERVYKTLGIEAQQLYSDLHAAPAAGVTAASPAPVSSVPKQGAKAGFVLDVERIAKLQKETEAVSALLAGIFVEEQPVEAAAATPAIPEETSEEAGTQAFWG